MIRIERISFSYRGKDDIFSEFSLSIEQGRYCAVLGPSGCGKSTFLYLLAGLLKPRQGMIFINGVPLDRPRPGTALVLQDHGLLPWATLEENVMLGWRIRRFYGPDGRHSPSGPIPDEEAFRKGLDHWIERLGLEGFRKNYPSQLSRGQRQRTALARSLSLDPDLLLLDEPFAALDARIKEDLMKAVLDLRLERPITVILVTHDLNEALFLCDKIFVMQPVTNRNVELFENPKAGLASRHGEVEALATALYNSRKGPS